MTAIGAVRRASSTAARHDQRKEARYHPRVEASEEAGLRPDSTRSRQKNLAGTVHRLPKVGDALQDPAHTRSSQDPAGSR